MARIPITVQVLPTAAGTVAPTLPPPSPQEVVFVDASALGHEFTNTGREIVIFRVGSGGTGSLTIVSKADVFGRLGNVGPTVVAPGTEKWFGPYVPKTNWGDGDKIFADPTSLGGSASIAVIKV